MVDRDTAKAASVLLTAAVTALVYIGGKAATISTLEAVAKRVQRGEFPEPIHPAGHA